MKVLVTGANGFIGKNLIAALERIEDIEICKFDIENTLEELSKYIEDVEFIFHLAGVNRPESNEEFYAGNRDLTASIVEMLTDKNLTIPILMTSSIQVEKDNDYGKSKLAGEQILKDYRNKTGAGIFIYRLPNVFGKWCRPNYNSVIATWCYNIANNLPIQVNDKDIELNLVYIDDVVQCFLSHLSGDINKDQRSFGVEETYTETLGNIENLLCQFRDSRKILKLSHIGTGFERALYATYLSYLPEDAFSYPLEIHSDERGNFAEVLKTIDSGQLSISTSKPGITRGNHYHDTKNEKLLVLKGKAIIKLRQIFSNKVVEYKVSDKNLEFVDIPPGYTHSITNVGNEEMILLLWANEVFDPENPDTYFVEV